MKKKVEVAEHSFRPRGISIVKDHKVTDIDADKIIVGAVFKHDKLIC